MQPESEVQPRVKSGTIVAVRGFAELKRPPRLIEADCVLIGSGIQREPIDQG